MADSGEGVLGGQGQQHVEPFATKWTAAFTNQVAKEAAVDSEPPAGSLGRDARWMAAFMSQATEGLRGIATSYARGRARIVERNGGRGDAAYAEDIVQDVFADTVLGDLSWDPERGALKNHVFRSIRSRTRHDRRRAKRVPHVALEALEESELTEVENALAENTAVSNAEDALSMARVLARLRQLAAGDREILALLDAMCAGMTERADLIHATRMSAPSYAAARRRLDRLVEELPQSAAPRGGAPWTRGSAKPTRDSTEPAIDSTERAGGSAEPTGGSAEPAIDSAEPAIDYRQAA